MAIEEEVTWAQVQVAAERMLVRADYIVSTFDRIPTGSPAFCLKNMEHIQRVEAALRAIQEQPIHLVWDKSTPF